jgi:hypothetical protein
MKEDFQLAKKMINSKYKGYPELSIAITQFRDDYTIKMEITPQNLKKKLDKESELLGKDYKVLAIYNGVALNSIEPISRALTDLRSGKTINLEKILE